MSASGKAAMMIPLEVIILIVGLAALIFAALTMSSLDKIKTSCGTTLDKKHYDMARNLQIAQMVVAGLIVILSGWVVASMLTAKTQIGALRGAADIRGIGRYFG